MTKYIFRRSQFVGRPVAEVFAFFEKPENLAKITPGSVGFEILTPTPIPMRTGVVIDYTIRVLGVRQHWTTLITDYEPPYRFVDVQLKGPYLFWHHTHRFESIDGGTMMHDTVEYVMPFGPLGRMIHALFVKRQLRSIFDYRAAEIARWFGSGERSHDSSAQPAVAGD